MWSLQFNLLAVYFWLHDLWMWLFCSHCHWNRNVGFHKRILQNPVHLAKLNISSTKPGSRVSLLFGITIFIIYCWTNSFLSVSEQTFISSIVTFVTVFILKSAMCWFRSAQEKLTTMKFARWAILCNETKHLISANTFKVPYVSLT